MMTQQTLPFDYYPSELYDKVAYHLTRKQIGVCRTVCCSWRALFTPSQYRHIHIRGQRQFNQLYQSLQPGIVGHYVRRLAVEDVYMSTEELESLPIFCPNLVVLSFNGKSIDTVQSNEMPSIVPYNRWKYLRRLTELQNLTVINRLLQAPFSSLTHLSIRFNQSDQTAMSNFLVNLHRARDLISLSLDSVTLSLSEIEMIHNACCDLRKLTLINSTLEPIGYTLEEKRSKTFDSVKPANKLTKFAYQNSQDLYDNYEWLNYFAHKYPYLESLELWCAYSIDTPARAQASMVDLEERYAALSSFGMMCHLLKSVKFLNITMNYWFFEAMDRAGTQLDTMAIGDLSDNTITLLQSLGASRQNVSSLTLWGWPSLCIQETMEEAIAMVGRCSNRLSRFTFSMRFSGIKNSPVPLELILNQCRNLTYLKLDNTQAALSSSMEMARNDFANNYNAFVCPTLNHLVLENGCFSNQVFDYVGMRCPSLTNLEISSCSFIADTLTNTDIKINLPHHALNMIKINHLRPPTYYHQKIASDIRLYDISFLHGTKVKHQIYELTDYQKYAATLSFNYEQKPLEVSRPTKYIRHNERPAGQFAFIQCQSLTQLNIGTLWII